MSLPALQRLRPAEVRDIAFGPGTLQVGLSQRALARLEGSPPSRLQMELLFSCLVRKRLLVDDEIPSEGRLRALIGDNLEISFRPVVARHCDADTYALGQPLDDLPLAEGREIYPRWVFLDYHQGRWQGDFGFSDT